MFIVGLIIAFGVGTWMVLILKRRKRYDLLLIYRNILTILKYNNSSK